MVPDLGQNPHKIQFLVEHIQQPKQSHIQQENPSTHTNTRLYI